MKMSFHKIFSCLILSATFQVSGASLNFEKVNFYIEDCFKQTELSEQPGHHNEESTASCRALIENQFIPKHIKAVALYNKGVIYHHSGQIEKAIADFHASYETLPKLAEAHVALSSIYYQRSQFDFSMLHVNKAIKLTGNRDDLVQLRNNIHRGKSAQLSKVKDKGTDEQWVN